MRKFTWLILVSICFSTVYAQNETAVFKNVNVIPMDKERVLTNQTVLVQDGIIVEIGAKIIIPKGSQIIDGKGKYLIPGLVDMREPRCTVIVESGHVPPSEIFAPNINNWLDETLGKVSN